VILKLYLDDIRTPKNDDFIIVRSFQEAIKFVQENGIPNYISFDHDLGCDDSDNIYPSGYDFAKWLIEMDLDNLYKFPEDFKFNVHSANPIGKRNIEGILNKYLEITK
jgi:hypothetical protein